MPRTIEGNLVAPKGRFALCVSRFNGLVTEQPVPGHKAQTRLREFGVGAQILRDLGLKQLKLLTHSEKQIIGVESYGLSIVEQVRL